MRKKACLIFCLTIMLLFTSCKTTAGFTDIYRSVWAIQEAFRGTGGQTAEASSGDEEYTVQELNFSRDGMKIYGKLFLPTGEGPFATVIIGHGFGSDMSKTEGYAEAFAKNGIAGVSFDFIGGGDNIKSDGVTTDMSVLTEAADMGVVLDGIREMEICDRDNIFLMGRSQGGFVATYTAAERINDIRGLIAFFPAYVIQDIARENTDNGRDIKDVSELNGVRIGRIYYEDALSFDIYEVMKSIDKNVLLIHGTADDLAPYPYSVRAAETMPHAQLITIEGAGHGFEGEDDVYAVKCAVEFVKDNMILGSKGALAPNLIPLQAASCHYQDDVPVFL